MVAAPTSCGKTCIALNNSAEWVSQGKPGLYFSFEIQSKSLAKRMIQTCAAVNLDRFRDGVLPPEKQKRVWEATEKVRHQKYTRALRAQCRRTQVQGSHAQAQAFH